ncbi:MAG: hypothetical protein J6X33_06870 [Clostridiales bacterium]|nr:hypothetical protein [Clostridiales bacterium]
MLINCTNHPYEIWHESQREAAAQYGEVKDLPFPDISPDLTPDDLRALAAEYGDTIEAMSPAAVLVAGEFTFAFMLTDRLLNDGVKVVCTCSRRVTEEVKKPDGTNEKKVSFLFEGFREYSRYDKG